MIRGGYIYEFRSRLDGARTYSRRTKRRGQIVADKTSHGQIVAGQIVAGEIVVDRSSRTFRCGQFVAEKMSHGQIAARTKRRMDKTLQ